MVSVTTHRGGGRSGELKKKTLTVSTGTENAPDQDVIRVRESISFERTNRFTTPLLRSIAFSPTQS